MKLVILGMAHFLLFIPHKHLKNRFLRLAESLNVWYFKTDASVHGHKQELVFEDTSLSWTFSLNVSVCIKAAILLPTRLMTGCSWLSQDKDLPSRSIVRTFLSHHEHNSLLRSKDFNHRYL